MRNQKLKRNDHKKLSQEQAGYKDLRVFSKVDQSDMLNKYFEVKKDISKIVQIELERMMDTPELNGLISLKRKCKIIALGGKMS